MERLTKQTHLCHCKAALTEQFIPFSGGNLSEERFSPIEDINFFISSEYMRDRLPVVRRLSSGTGGFYFTDNAPDEIRTDLMFLTADSSHITVTAVPVRRYGSGIISSEAGYSITPVT